MERAAAALLARVAPEIEPRDLVESLSPAQQQMVEIAKALSLDSRVIIFDEPTAALTDSETRRLFEVIRELKTHGTSSIYISHRLEEIFVLADRVTVLKDGAWQGSVAVAETNHDDLIRRMVGRDLQSNLHVQGSEQARCNLKSAIFQMRRISRGQSSYVVFR